MISGGMAWSPIGWVISAIGAGYLLYKNKHDSIVVFILIALTLGDSRMSYFQFFKNIRMVLLIMVAIYSIYEFRTNRYKLNANFLYFTPFVSVALLAMISSPMLSLAINKTISFVLLYFVTLHYFNNKMEKYGKVLMHDVMMTLVSILIIGLIFLPIIPSMVMYGLTRYNGLLGNPNGVGIYVTLTAPVLAYVFARNPEISSRFKTLAWIVLIASLLLCSSRNAIFSVSIFLTIYYGMQGSIFKRIGFIFVFLPVIGIFFMAIDLQDLVFALGLEKYFRVRDFESGSGRVFAWQHAIELIKKSPIIGCGFGCEEYNFIYRTSYRLWATGHQGGVHNSYLAFTVNTGIVGASLFYGFIANILRQVKNIRFLAAFVPSFLFSAMFESWMFSSLNSYHIIFCLFIVHIVVDSNSDELLTSNVVAGKLEKSPTEQPA